MCNYACLGHMGFPSHFLRTALVVVVASQRTCTEQLGTGVGGIGITNKMHTLRGYEHVKLMVYDHVTN